AQNKDGIKPEALETVDITSGKPKEIEPEFVDVVGQISLKSLEKNSRKRRDNDRRSNAGANPQQRNQPRGQQGQQRPPQNQQLPPQNQQPNEGGNQQQRPQQKPRNRPNTNNNTNNRSRPPQNQGK
ncbi:MAG: hypothetical protein ABIW47_10105, partial [Ginsengibacter sp.]